jgi:hypothetical protein
VGALAAPDRSVMHNTEKNMDEEYEKIVARYSASYMSDSKWRKLFLAWARSGVEIRKSEWHFIDSEHTENHNLPREHDIMEKRFADGQFQPFEYKWIFEIHIPSTFRPDPNTPFEKMQDIERLKQIAAKLGKYPIYDTADGIVLRAYEK